VEKLVGFALIAFLLWVAGVISFPGGGQTGPVDIRNAAHVTCSKPVRNAPEPYMGKTMACDGRYVMEDEWDDYGHPITPKR